MSDDKLGTVSINGQAYRVMLETYRARDLSDFSPRTTTPGGGVIFSEMALYQPLTISDFKHGYGFHWFTDAAGYLETVGSVDTRHAGIAMLWNTPSARKYTVNMADGAVIQSHLDTYQAAYSYGTYPLKYNESTGTWSEIAAFNAASANGGLTTRCMWSNGTYTFLSRGVLRLQKCNDSSLTTWSNTGIGDESAGYLWFIAHDGFVYACQYGSNYVNYDDTEDLSGLHGGPSNDPAAIAVGTPGHVIKKAISYAGSLFFARTDGLFKMDSDRGAARRVLDYSDQDVANNFDLLSTFNGNLIFNIRNQVYQWNGTRVSVITPPLLTDTFPYEAYTGFEYGNVIGNHIFMLASRSTGTGTDIICFDGVGWFKLYRSTEAISMMNFITNNSWQTDYLWISIGGAAAGLYYFQFQQKTDFPHASFPTTGQHSLITSRLEAGFRRVIKSSPSVLIEASNLAAGRTLRLFYRKDGATAWTAWGGTDGTTNVISANGITELKNPLGTANSTLEYYYIQFRIDFITNSATSTPVLEGITLRLLMRPDTDYGYSMTLVISKEVEYGMGNTDNRDTKTMLADLHTARDSKVPIIFIDPFEVSHQVYVTSINEMAIEKSANDMGAYPNVEHQVIVNLIEVS